MEEPNITTPPHTSIVVRNGVCDFTPRPTSDRLARISVNVVDVALELVKLVNGSIFHFHSCKTRSVSRNTSEESEMRGVAATCE